MMKGRDCSLAKTDTNNLTHNFSFLFDISFYKYKQTNYLLQYVQFTWLHLQGWYHWVQEWHDNSAAINMNNT